MVLALGSRFVDDPRLVIPTSPSHPTGASQSRGFDFFRASSASASPTLVSATLFDIQCSLLCVLWLMGELALVVVVVVMRPSLGDDRGPTICHTLQVLLRPSLHGLLWDLLVRSELGHTRRTSSS